jgi:hypothetical protein
MAVRSVGEHAILRRDWRGALTTVNPGAALTQVKQVAAPPHRIHARNAPNTATATDDPATRHAIH